MMARFLVAALLVLGACGGQAQDDHSGHPAVSTGRAVVVLDDSKLILEIPESWDLDTDAASPPGIPTYLWRSDAGGCESVTVSVLRKMSNNPRSLNDDALRKFVEFFGKKVLPRAVEQDLELHDIPGSVVEGYYYQLHDKMPGSGECTVLTQGVAEVGDVWIQFTVLSSDIESTVIGGALQMMAGVRATE